MKAWQKTRLLFAALLLSGSTGCISWYSGSAQAPGEGAAGARAASLPEAERTRIDFDVTYQVVGMNASNDQRQSAVDNISGWAREAFEETGRYRKVPDSADVTLRIDVTDNGSPNIGLAVLSGITLTILPAVATDEFTIDAELTSADHKPLGSRRITEKMTTLIQLFMVFGMPVASPKSVSTEMWHVVFGDLATWTDATLHDKRPKVAGEPHRTAG